MDTTDKGEPCIFTDESIETDMAGHWQQQQNLMHVARGSATESIELDEAREHLKQPLQKDAPRTRKTGSTIGDIARRLKQHLQGMAAPRTRRIGSTVPDIARRLKQKLKEKVTPSMGTTEPDIDWRSKQKQQEKAEHKSTIESTERDIARQQQQQRQAKEKNAASPATQETGESIEEEPPRPRPTTVHGAPPTSSGLSTPTCAQDPDAKVEEEDDFCKTVEKVRRAIPARYDTSPPSIYVVPRDLAEGKQDPYEPAVVCIGLLQPVCKRENQALEHYKWCLVRSLIVNTASSSAKSEEASWVPDEHVPLLRTCLDTVRGLEPQIRASYGGGGSIAMDASGGSQKQVALMMLLDGCFVLHRLLKYARLASSRDNEKDDDWTQVFGRCGVWGMVTRDLLLLNNQIPFFLVRELFKLLNKSRPNESDHVLIDGGLRLFASLRPGRAGIPSTGIASSTVRHLLHLFYLSVDISPIPTRHLPPPDARRKLPPELQNWVPCAKELEDAGVTFRAGKRQDRRSFLDVRFFHGGVLEIPALELYDYSEPLFRNLIALEQTNPDTRDHITAYAVFMDCLIKTPEDMRLLHRRGVLVSHMNGDRDVASGFFSRVCAQVHTYPGQNYLHCVMEDVVRYQSARWPRWRAALVRNYFSNPWVTTSILAAALLLLMTVLQTFFSVYGYFKPAVPH